MNNSKQHDQSVAADLRTTTDKKNQSAAERVNHKQLGYRFCSLFNAVMNSK